MEKSKSFNRVVLKPHEFTEFDNSNCIITELVLNIGDTCTVFKDGNLNIMKVKDIINFSDNSYKYLLEYDDCSF